MVNEKLKEILRDCSTEELKYHSTGFTHTRTVDYDKFGAEVVGETILAILAADCREFTRTTYDKDFVDAIISRVVDSVRNHWEFK